MSPDYIIKKGDTLYEIGLRNKIDWKRIWNHETNVANQDLGTRKSNGKIRVDADNKPIRKPEWIEPGQKLFIPDQNEIKRESQNPDEKLVVTIRRPNTTNEIPRFDCHSHIHADSVFRVYSKICRVVPEPHKSMLCSLEADNFRKVSNPTEWIGQVAVVSLLLDMTYCPLWYRPDVGSSIYAPALDVIARNVRHYIKPANSSNTQLHFWDPYDAFPPGQYFVVDDNLVDWIDVVTQINRENFGYSFPFVPFDPRRPGALKFVKHAIEECGFVGIKLYTRTGWLLSNNHALYGDEVGRQLDEKVNEMIEWAKSNSVPMLNHCSPGGWPPDEHIAFPKAGFPRLTASESELDKFEHDLYMRYHRPTPFQSTLGSARRLVVGLRKRGEVVNRDSLTKALKRIVDSKYKNELGWLTLEQKRRWCRLSLAYASDFDQALKDYKQITVSPQIPQGTRFCMAHCGSDAILLDEIPNTSEYNAVRTYAAHHDSARWVKKAVIAEQLDAEPDAFVDLAYFTGIKGDVAVDLFKRLLLWIAEKNYKDRLLFGTDWPLIDVNESINLSMFWSTVAKAAATPEVADVWPTCWDDITRQNPLRFLGLQDTSTKTVERLSGFYNSVEPTENWLSLLDKPQESADGAPVVPMQIYRVKEADTLAKIAEQFWGSQAHVGNLLSANTPRFEPHQVNDPQQKDRHYVIALVVGESLLVPVRRPEGLTPAPIDNAQWLEDFINSPAMKVKQPKASLELPPKPYFAPLGNSYSKPIIEETVQGTDHCIHYEMRASGTYSIQSDEEIPWRFDTINKKLEYEQQLKVDSAEQATKFFSSIRIDMEELADQNDVLSFTIFDIQQQGQRVALRFDSGYFVLEYDISADIVYDGVKHTFRGTFEFKVLLTPTCQLEYRFEWIAAPALIPNVVVHFEEKEWLVWTMGVAALASSTLLMARLLFSKHLTWNPWIGFILGATSTGAAAVTDQPGYRRPTQPYPLTPTPESNDHKP